MSSNSNSGSESDSGSDSDDQGGAGRREVAYRLFAAEFEDADFSYSESDEERAPNYVVTPTGARVNRLFLVGVLTEVEEAGEDILRARIVDPTGAFVVYAGQYQPEAQAFFDQAQPPAFVAVTGKARTFQPDDSDVTYTSVRPENVNEVDAETRDRWSVGTARQTLSRVATMAGALDLEERGDDLRQLLESQGVDVGLAAGIPLAIGHYGTTGAYLEAVRDLSVQVAEVVTDERDEVAPFSTAPDASGPADLAALATLDVPASAGGEPDVDVETGAVSEPTNESTSSAAGTTTDTATSNDTATSTAEATESTETADATQTTETTETADAETTDTETADAGITDTETVETETSENSEPTDATAEPSTSTAETAEVGATSEEAEPVDTEPATGGDDEIGDFEPGEFELDEEEREAIEEEYGTGFQSGNEVDEPGEADIDTPEPNAEPDEADDGAQAATETETVAETSEVESAGSGDDTATEAETETGTTAAGSTETEATEEPETDTADVDADDEAGDVDLDEAVMDAMQANDEGDGAPEDAIVAAVTDRLGADEGEVREALQEALMGGQCYEPEDGVYKPI